VNRKACVFLYIYQFLVGFQVKGFELNKEMHAREKGGRGGA
jgi:hypothetical protein